MVTLPAPSQESREELPPSLVTKSGQGLAFKMCGAVLGGGVVALLHTSWVREHLNISVGVFDFTSIAIETAAIIFAIITIFDGNEIRNHLVNAVRKLTGLESSTQVSIGQLKSLESGLSTQIDEVGKLKVQFGDIKDALSTQYIGVFPDYLPYIQHNIAHATSHIRLMCDFVGHGSFSDPPRWNPIREELQRALKGLDSLGMNKMGAVTKHHDREVIVDLVFANDKEQMKLLLKEFRPFRNDGEWTRMLVGNAYPEVSALVKSWPSIPRTEEWKQQRFQHWNRIKFLECFEQEEKSIHSELEWMDGPLRSVKSDSSLPFYLWIQDEAEAIFAFPTHGESDVRQKLVVATAFLTKDQNIVKRSHCHLRADKSRGEQKSVNGRFERPCSLSLPMQVGQPPFLELLKAHNHAV